VNDRVGRIADRCAEGAVADSEDDLNLYAYTRYDPVGSTDPSGTCQNTGTRTGRPTTAQTCYTDGPPGGSASASQVAAKNAAAAELANVYTQQRVGTIARDAADGLSVAGDAAEEGFKLYAAGKILGAMFGAFKLGPQFTARNLRANLIGLSAKDPGPGFQAHHVLPQQFEARFIALGIRNIHDPKYGAWVATGKHQDKVWHGRYNRDWDGYLSTNPSPAQIETFARVMASKYGF
jgi:hypothetical protein